jgi:hypothetical protein
MKAFNFGFFFTNEGTRNPGLSDLSGTALPTTQNPIIKESRGKTLIIREETEINLAAGPNQA